MSSSKRKGRVPRKICSRRSPDIDVKHEQESSSHKNDPEEELNLKNASQCKQTKPFSCNQCDYSTTTYGYLKKHLRRHSEEKPFCCPVSGCGFSTRYPNNIHHHMSAHSENRPFSCVTCGMAFKRKSCLQNHMLRHTDSKPFSCEHCDYKCKRRWELKSHLLSHSNQRFFKCGVCGHATKTKSDLKKHEVKHITTKSLMCPICNKAFSHHGSLSKHRRYFHTDHPNVTCSECDRVLKNENTLKRHIEVYHKGIKNFKCDVCDMRFSTRHNKTMHMVVHSEDRTFPCPFCPYFGHEEWHVKAHIGSMHGKDKPYICDLCHVGFKRMQGLRQHYGSEKHKRNMRFMNPPHDNERELGSVCIKLEPGHPEEVTTNGIPLDEPVSIKEEPVDEYESKEDKATLSSRISSLDSDLSRGSLSLPGEGQIARLEVGEQPPAPVTGMVAVVKVEVEEDDLNNNRPIKSEPDDLNFNADALQTNCLIFDESQHGSDMKAGTGIPA